MEIYIDCGDVALNKGLFDRLYEESESLETAFGEKLAWERLDERRACRVATYRSGSIEQDPQVLEEIRKWMIDRLLKFKKVFDAPLTDLLGG